MKFSELRSQMISALAAVSELQSVCYTILQKKDTCFDLRYCLVAYYDKDSNKMNYTITNDEFVELKLVENLSPSMIIEFGNFVSAIEDWVAGKVDEYPYHPATEADVTNILLSKHKRPVS